MRAYKKDGRPECSIDGCNQPLYCKSLCTTHYSRMRRAGDVGEATRKKGHYGAGSVNGDGYRVLHSEGHPLAVAQGKVLEHRVVLFNALGAGQHSCHWCGVPLTWRGPAKSRINVDHLDWDKLNNDAANLVPSCLDCNTKRCAA